MAAASDIPALSRTIFHVDMDAFFVSVEELYDPSLKGRLSSSAGSGMSAAWFRRLRMRRESSECIRRCRCAPRPSFVRRLFSSMDIRSAIASVRKKFTKCSTTFSPQVEMASIDEAYLDMTGTERLHGPPMRAAHKLHQRDERRNTAQLFHRHRILAAGGEGFLRAGQAQRRAVDCSGRRSAVSRAAGRARDSRRRQGDGEATCMRLASRKSATSPRLEEAELKERFGKWGLALAGKARGEDAGGWFDSRSGRDDRQRNRSATNTLTTKIPRTATSWKLR